MWTKPGDTTKQKTEHRVPLSAPALELLAAIRTAAPDFEEIVFPWPAGGGSPRRSQKALAEDL